LGGGCAVPVAAYATVIDSHLSEIKLCGLVISEDGKKAIQVNRSGPDALALGNELAQRAIAQGAHEIIKIGIMS
jgi:porphobilinogen deaminase